MKPTGIYADDQGHLFCDIELADREGTSFASCKVRTAGHTHRGISTFTTNDENLELLEAGGTWDCREWQWWENHGYGTEMRPRHVPATSGYKQESSETYVMSQYVCDGIKIELEWTFPL